MTRKTPLKDSIQYEIFNRIEYDYKSVDRLAIDKFRVLLPKKWIRYLKDMSDGFLVVDDIGELECTSPSNKGKTHTYIRTYVDVTLIDGYKEYQAMMKL